MLAVYQVISVRKSIIVFITLDNKSIPSSRDQIWVVADNFALGIVLNFHAPVIVFNK